MRILNLIGNIYLNQKTLVKNIFFLKFACVFINTVTGWYFNIHLGVASSIPARSHTFVEIDREIRSFSSLPMNHSRRVVVSYKYVHEVLVNCLFKLAQEKVWLGELTVPP